MLDAAASVGLGDTAPRLARFFGTSERFWMNLRTQFDLDTEYDREGERIERETVPYAVGSSGHT